MSAEASQRQPQAGSSGRPPTLGERYEILSEARLPGLDSPHAQAYQVRDWKASGEPNYALVCERELLPRIDLLERFARIESEHIVKPLSNSVQIENVACSVVQLIGCQFGATPVR